MHKENNSSPAENTDVSHQLFILSCQMIIRMLTWSKLHSVQYIIYIVIYVDFLMHSILWHISTIFFHVEIQCVRVFLNVDATQIQIVNLEFLWWRPEIQYNI
jgi:hypothetical protein